MCFCNLKYMAIGQQTYNSLLFHKSKDLILTTVINTPQPISLANSLALQTLNK